MSSAEEDRGFPELLADLKKLPPKLRDAVMELTRALAEERREMAVAQPPSTASRFDHGDARKRLHAISDDPEVLDGFERLVQSGDFDDAFLQATYDANISFDYLLFGDGRPFMTA